jgi:hypothetical protein
MLAPGERRLLLDVLAPPEGHVLDEAIGTTYTLDLLALLRVPLAATALPWADRRGGPVDNPFALLTALRRNASRISLYCHAGAARVPGRHVALLAFLEDAVHPVTPPRAGGTFHPKLWLLRFAPEFEGAPVLYRLLVLSRNLTFDRSWDVALLLDGELGGRGRSINRPLSDLVAALPVMAEAAGTRLDEAARERAERLAVKVRCVDWTLPEGFDELTFHAIGHDGRPRWPVTDLRRLFVLSPFVGPGALARLRGQVREDMTLAGRFDELVKLDPAALTELDEVEVFDDPGRLLDVEDDAPEAAPDPDAAVELSGLHAKVYVGERGRRAAVFVGSANATEGAFALNVELLVELGGSRKQHGIDALLGVLRRAGLLTPFRPADAADVDEPAEAQQPPLERLAHALASGGLVARLEPGGEDRWRPLLEAAAPVALDGLQVQARPLSENTLRPVDLTASPCCSFPPAGRSSITAFFHLRVSGRTESGDRHLDVTARLPLEGAPDGRIEAVTADLLSDRERLLRFILLLLAEDGESDRMLDELEALLGERRTASVPAGGDGAAPGLPLLEPLLRALHRDPERLEEIDRLLRDVRTAGGDTADLLPPELDALWQTIGELREARA